MGEPDTAEDDPQIWIDVRARAEVFTGLQYPDQPYEYITARLCDPKTNAGYQYEIHFLDPTERVDSFEVRAHSLDQIGEILLALALADQDPS